MAKQQLTEGSVIRSLFKLSVPIVMANFLQTAYQLTDTFWVGRLGANEVAALSLSFPVIFLLISMGGGFAISGTILVSQYAGQRNQSMVSKVCLQTLMIIVVVSLALAGSGLSSCALCGLCHDKRPNSEGAHNFLFKNFLYRSCF